MELEDLGGNLPRVRSHGTCIFPGDGGLGVCVGGVNYFTEHLYREKFYLLT